jgi:hypothetical protein
MSLMTLAPAADGFSADDLDRAAGRADAYDDSKTLTVDELIVRAGANTDYHPSLAYALGYMDRVIEFRLELDAVSGAEFELAYTDHRKKARR